MAFRPGLPPIQLLFLRRGLSRPILAWSLGVHVVAFGLAAWATREPVHQPFRVAETTFTRQYAVQYFMLPPEIPKPAAHAERRPASRRGPVTAMAIPERFVSNAEHWPDAGGEAAPARRTALATELPVDSVAGVGPGLATGPHAAASPSLLARLGFRVPAAGGLTNGRDSRSGLVGGDSASRGGTRVAELLTADGTACPALRRPPGWRQPGLTVAVAFVVDARGIVDPRSLRVVESPERPQTDHRYVSHIYAVSSTARVDGRLRDAGAAYDSLLTDEVMSHVANLLFRPAMRDGQAIRSTVLVSCQSPT